MGSQSFLSLPGSARKRIGHASSRRGLLSQLTYCLVHVLERTFRWSSLSRTDFVTPRELPSLNAGLGEDPFRNRHILGAFRWNLIARRYTGPTFNGLGRVVCDDVGLSSVVVAFLCV